ncbi:peptide chain release factor 3 [Parvularcula dongshanensis]|uniref:Peptide chain release factor 3 n=1 Tax=Parvularcula dongshanensis TaxID=1173995 RepID=A0A840I4P8_9PROT|nr:peptide chain release factor 3 [Parvularcula dongshanensis]
MDGSLPIAKDAVTPEWMRRRTFAIIAHPDAGKTTLTERLLVAGGALRMAGQVKARGERRRTQSDWMEVEQKRGISITSSVMTFEAGETTFNLLDTPGHQDFSEDTYRTLTAVDSAVMVIDAAKGIESQTLKLLEVCRLRDVPITVFINKVDREARDPFSLLDEIGETLALDLSPVTWALGSGTQFQGCWDMVGNRLIRPQGESGTADGGRSFESLDDPAIEKLVDPSVLEQAREEVALSEAAYPPVDGQSYRDGHLSPVVFGSALKDFCVPELLNLLSRLAPPPRTQPAAPAPVQPDEDRVSGFVFKVQANMDPNHRDRIAFTRLCSGKFTRGMKLKQSRTGKPLAVQNPIFFFARERELAEEAFAGDIIGIPNHGTLRVGDTLYEGTETRFTGIPDFAPEILRKVRLDDPLKAKQLNRALHDLAEEGVTQIFFPRSGSGTVVGVVGQLQLDVLLSRLSAEYGVTAGFDPAPCETVRWVSSDDQKAMADFLKKYPARIADDRDGDPVYLAPSAWDLGRVTDDWTKLSFAKTKERG